MKILIVSTIYSPNTGGSASYFKILINSMENSNEFSNIYLLTEFIHGLPILERIGKLTTIRLMMPRDGYRAHNLLYKCVSYIFVQIVIFFTTIFLKKKLQIVHMHSRTMNFFTNFYLKFLGIPVIIDIRDNFFKPQNLTSANVLICASENIYENIKKKIINSKVYHIPIPINYNFFTKKISPIKRDSMVWEILYAGTITENKGIRELIDAVRILHNRKIKFNLSIVGKNLTRNDILDNLPIYIKYKGEMEQNNLYEEMRHCDLFILPSKSEGMPRVCLEAIALGKLTLVPPNIPEFNKVCQDFVLERIESRYIAKKIERIIKSDLLKLEYPIGNHKPENSFKKTIKAYKSAIKSNN
jgi:glycosyltransferase involved in cell wall biosynthesis